MNETANNGHTIMGGQGGRLGREDLRIATVAFDNDYPITPDIRKLIVNQATLIAGTAKSKRLRIAAMKVLIAADRCNLERQATNQDKRKTEWLEGVDLSEVLARAEEHRRINHAESMPIIEDNNAGEDKPG